MVELSIVKDKDLFREILQVLYIDVEDNQFMPDKDYSHKMRCLAVVLKNGSKQNVINQDDPLQSHNFVIPEDINMCCNLIRIRLDKLKSQILDQTWG